MTAKCAKDIVRYLSLSSYFEKIVEEYIGNYSVYICFDQLDENWLDGELLEYGKILVNLITTCKEINSKSKTKSNIKCLLFLRSDIFDTLKFNDKNKIFQDSAVEIAWDAEKLDNMFFSRVKKYMDSSIELGDESGCNSLFNIKLVRHSITPFRHILRRTFYRPRDIIVYFNKLKAVHDSKLQLYTSNDLYSAQKDFSISMYNELMDEWAIQKPEIKDYLAVLQNIGTQIFTYDEYCMHFIETLDKKDRSIINESLIFLFQNSIIGQKRSINWEYVCTHPYIQIDFKKRFHVNYGLIDRLTLVEKREK